jgi:hypothetical protein
MSAAAAHASWLDVSWSIAWDRGVTDAQDRRGVPLDANQVILGDGGFGISKWMQVLLVFCCMSRFCSTLMSVLSNELESAV